MKQWTFTKKNVIVGTGVSSGVKTYANSYPV